MYNEKELISLLVEAESKIDDELTYSRMDDLSQQHTKFPTAKTYVNRFGSWNEARYAAGLGIVQEGKKND